jgi:hypothetical protein
MDRMARRPPGSPAVGSDYPDLSGWRFILIGMWKVLLEALLGWRRVRALRSLLAGVIAAVMILAPGTAAAIFRTAIHEEQARITPLLEQMTRQLTARLDRGQRPHLAHSVQRHLHH